ncbi:MAG TPA: hypothetical protein VMU69_07530 [Bradyrhizobium sp.]|nr:hypothetical protein [Bradyrhizobium sp.]
MLRFISELAPQNALQAIATALHEALGGTNMDSPCAIPNHGWLVWTMRDLRSSFLCALELERNLDASLRRIDGDPTRHFRWGIWVDQYVVPFDAYDRPAISNTTARAIFNFEPDNVLLCSDAVTETNRHWEHFVCVPRRMLHGAARQGYRLLDHRRPSALDHAEIADGSPFTGKAVELALLDTSYRESLTKHSRVAVVAEAGCGKTRLVREWAATAFGPPCDGGELQPFRW